MKNKFKKLIEAKSKYDKAIEDLENELKPYIKFKFHIIHQASDGFVILDEDNNNGKLSWCMDIIQKKGELSIQDYYIQTI